MTIRILLYTLAVMTSLAVAQAKPYLGGELFHNTPVRYGKFEARMMMGAVSGTVSSMFLYYNESYVGLPEPWREIDIEVLGNDPDSVQTNLLTGHSKAKVHTEGMHYIPKTSTTWRTYTMIWTPDSIVWLIDGVSIRKDAGTQQVTDLQSKDMNLRFNMWASTSPGWVGPWNDAALPAYQYINWIQYSSYTPGQGPGASNFTPVWKEDFNSLSNSWGTANWTFVENRADFSPDNVVVKDGVVVLCLTKATSPGHQGAIPADSENPSPILKDSKAPATSSLTGSKDKRFNLLGQKL